MTSLSRRAFIALAATLATPRWAAGQPARRTYRLGWLGTIDSSKEPYSVAFVQRLRELGFADGANLARALGVSVPESIRVRVDRVIDH
jgi:hypothetical protein